MEEASNADEVPDADEHPDVGPRADEQLLEEKPKKKDIRVGEVM